MTVKELIEKLEVCDPSLQVRLYDGEYDVWKEVQYINTYKLRNPLETSVEGYLVNFVGIG